MHEMSTPSTATQHWNLTALISTRIPAEMKKEMKAAARAKGKPLSVASREALAEWIERNRVLKKSGK